MKRNFSILLVGLLIAVVLSIYLKLARNPGSSTPENIAPVEPAISESSTPGEGDRTNRPAKGAPFPEPAENSKTSSADAQDLSARAGERPAETNKLPTLPPDMVLQNVRRVVHQYGAAFGGNPVGTNPEITAALSGNNPKHINFLAGQPGCRVSGNGELVDNWGTPFFFHQLSGMVMEIHSAGPDQVMWTSDDLVTK